MSYWTSCTNCERELEYPTLEEQLLQSRACPCCMEWQGVEVPLGDALVELLERVRALEEKS